MHKILIVGLSLFLMLTGVVRVHAQTNPAKAAADTVPTTGDNLLAELADSTKPDELLPHKMIFTQRAFWGPKGLLRTSNVAPLTPEGRAKELKIRRTMLVTHQVMGFMTLGGFVAQGLVGANLYHASGDRYRRLQSAHEALATGVNISYSTTALLSLLAPPKMVGERRGLSSIKLHKYLAMIHIAGMITTNILANSLEGNPQLKPYHRAAAYTTFGAYALSVVAIKF